MGGALLLLGAIGSWLVEVAVSSLANAPGLRWSRPA